MAWSSLSFTPELAAVEPEAFVKDVLLGRLRAQEIVVGFNHRFGRGARGDARLLQELASRLGFRAHVVPSADGRRRAGLVERDTHRAAAGRCRRRRARASWAGPTA